jgi:hypothetical protein
MPRYGLDNQRLSAEVRLQVLRGWDPNEPRTQTAALPVAEGVTIKSGQVISKQWNATDSIEEWILGVSAANSEGGLSAEPFIAQQDSADGDVLESGNLVGLSCAGDFELQTAHFKHGDAYPSGTPLTFDAVTGDIKAAAAIVAAAAGAQEPILGFISKRSPIDLSGVNSSAVALAGDDANYANQIPVVQFRTEWIPNNFLGA